MTAAHIALCVDEATQNNPALIGLDGERFDAQGWLDVYTTGETARSALSCGSVPSEVWVASCDDVDPINLAATLKADRPDLCVRLLGFDRCGSLYSRAYNASIDEVMELGSFVRRYGCEKEEARLALAETPSLVDGGDRPTVSHAKEQLDGVGDREAEPAMVLPVNERAPRSIEFAAPMRPRGFVLPVVSGSGGAGKSAVSVTSAFIASRMGYRVLLVDYDLQFGDAAVLSGKEGALALDSAINHPEQLEQELRKNLNPTVLAAPGRLEDADNVSRVVPSLIDDLSGAFDVIVANTGAAWAEYHAALLERSSAALFLVDQRASSLRACRHALELCARCGIATGPFQFAVNRCAKGAPLTSTDVSCALQGALVHEIDDGGPDVEECLGAGAVSDLIETGNPFSESLERMLQQTLPGAGLLTVERMENLSDKRSAKKRARHAGKRRGWGL